MDRESLHNWKIQDRICRNFERIKLQMKQLENVRTVRFTKSQAYDSTMQTWLDGMTLNLVETLPPRKVTLQI